MVLAKNRAKVEEEEGLRLNVKAVRGFVHIAPDFQTLSISVAPRDSGLALVRVSDILWNENFPLGSATGNIHAELLAPEERD